MATKRSSVKKAARAKAKPVKKDDSLVLLNFKLSRSEKRSAEAKANKSANGNLSALIRFALKKVNPTAKDLVDLLSA